VRLANETIRLDIEEPGEGYVGSRFDWTGKITQIAVGGRHTFCTEETTDPALVHQGGRGLFNEFGIDEPIGYEDCPVGEVFLKPGVGLLTRLSEEPYDFFQPYPVTPGTTRWEADERSAWFEFRGATPRGHDVVVRKEITLDGPGFSIHYTLTNRGQGGLSTNEYVHNFLSIDHESLGPAYRLTCTFPLEPAGFSEVVNPGGVVLLREGSAEWTGPPTVPFYFGGLRPGGEGGIGWRLEHTGRHLAIEESVDFAVQRFALWGTGHVVSPELFRKIEVPAGDTARWSRSYRILSTGS
jgi:hypothetical protein